MEIALEHLEMIPKILSELEQIKSILSEDHYKRWLTVKDLATYLGYSKETIYKLKGDCFVEGTHFYNKTGKLLFDRVAIDDWVVSDNKSVHKDIIHEKINEIVESVLKK